MNHEIKVRSSSGNIFSDIGLPNSSELLIKAELVRQISSLITAFSMSQLSQYSRSLRVVRACRNNPNDVILLKQDLRTPTKKPGFLPNLRTATKYFSEKPGFWAHVSPIRTTCSAPYETFLEARGVQNPVSASIFQRIIHDFSDRRVFFSLSHD